MKSRIDDTKARSSAFFMQIVRFLSSFSKEYFTASSVQKVADCVKKLPQCETLYA